LEEEERERGEEEPDDWVLEALHGELCKGRH
jgi:hypothetical protein